MSEPPEAVRRSIWASYANVVNKLHNREYQRESAQREADRLSEEIGLLRRERAQLEIFAEQNGVELPEPVAP